MFTLVVLAIIAIGLIAAASYGAISTIKATETVMMAQRNAVQVEAIAAMLRSSLRPVDGVLRAPMGAPSDGGWTGLPTWLGISVATPWGAAYAYCPYAPGSGLTGGSVEVIKQGDGSDGYAVELATVGGAGGHPYVVASDTPPLSGIGDQAVAFILSPVPGKATPPRCADIETDGTSGRYRIADDAPIQGSVVAVSASVNEALSAASTFGYALYVAPVPTGAGTGRGPASAMALADALALWRATQPGSLTIHMAPGTYGLTAADADLSNAAVPPGRGLRLVGDGATIEASGSGVALILPVDTALEGLAVHGMAIQALPGTRLSLKNVALSGIVGDGADINLSGSIAFTGTGGTAILLGGGARLTAVNAALSFTGSFASAIRAGGSFAGFYASSVSIASGGSVATWVRLESGTLVLENGTSFGAPSGPHAGIGIEDEAGHGLSGLSAQVYAGSVCFEGPLFGGSINGVANSGATGAAAIANRATWLCN